LASNCSGISQLCEDISALLLLLLIYSWTLCRNFEIAVFIFISQCYGFWYFELFGISKSSKFL